MRTIAVLLLKDLRRFSRDRFAILLWLGIPMAIGTIMILASRGADGPQPRARLLVVDNDQNAMSRSVVSLLGSNRFGDTIQVEQVGQDEGRKRIQQDSASAMLVIPKGFAQAVVTETPTEMILVMNPSQRILPQMVAERLRLLADGAFYLHRVLEPIASTNPAASNDSGVGNRARAVVRMIQSGRRTLFPPVIGLRLIEAQPELIQGAGGYPASFLFLPSIVMLGLLFTAQGLSSDIWRERESGMLCRLATSPVGIAQMLVGKLLAMAVMLLIVASVVLVAGMIYFELPWTRWIEALVWSVGVGVMLTAMMLVAQVFGSTRAGASIVTYAITMPLMMIGGSMFPLEMMPRWMASVGSYTPNGWGSVRLKAVLLGTSSWPETGMALALVLAISTVLVTIAGLRIQRTVDRR